ncbi:hypothetical protein P608_10115 [Comamonas thiooxydans]|uniref:Uncharacterized protein n=1 Tax=Comamonas thiooxydans TaxID=363952 RepID=A0A0E3BYT3_9BURK|nr:hypothetical protein P608_10115 [Comamonas thiooxydans]KGH17196.1 hypothetical protein P607_18200 [Comamonas thiooxydans]
MLVRWIAGQTPKGYSIVLITLVQIKIHAVSMRIITNADLFQLRALMEQRMKTGSAMFLKILMIVAMMLM